jgi:hypothetical protein
MTFQSARKAPPQPKTKTTLEHQRCRPRYATMQLSKQVQSLRKMCIWQQKIIMLNHRHYIQITYKAQNCHGFYIGKSQRYVKTQVQEHLGEVTKLCHKHILLTNLTQTTTPPSPYSQTSSQEPYVATTQLTTIIQNGPTMQLCNNRNHSNMSTIADENVPPNHMTFEPPQNVNFCLPIDAALSHHDAKQDN